MKLTKLEKEMIILVNEIEDQVNIFTYYVSFKTPVGKFQQEISGVMQEKRSK